MDRNIDDDEFEIFLKQKVDQHKLYPSDKAWKGIYNSLHPGMKWFKIGGTLLIFTLLLIVYQESSLFNSSHIASNASGRSLTKLLPGTKPLPDIATKQITISSKSFFQTKTYNNLKGSIAANTNEPLIKDISTDLFYSDNAGVKINAHNDHLKGFLLHTNNSLDYDKTINVAIPSNNIVSAEVDQSDISAGFEILKPIFSTVIGNTLPNEQAVSVKDFNWLQEMAAIKLTPQKKSKFNLQFYFSPSVSYRKLADNQNTSHSGLLNFNVVPRDLNINKYVDHNPAIGVELGSNVLFALSKNFIIKSGLQLNYSRYNIKAYKTLSEKAIIALNTTGPVSDTLSSYTSLRNFSGFANEELQNQYLQVSIPVGAELKLLGNKRLQFSVAGTIQPTFLLFSDTYLLSTNYLNYIKEPSLVRKWNVHSSVEAFLSYKTGGLRWQLGPQFRYQLKSSFTDRYPIKEYLFEYGVKVGVSKTIR